MTCGAELRFQRDCGFGLIVKKGCYRQFLKNCDTECRIALAQIHEKIYLYFVDPYNCL